MALVTEQAQWDKLVHQLGGSFLQSWQWGEFQSAAGRPVYRWQAEVDGDTIAMQWLVHKLPFKQQYAFSPYGPLGATTPQQWQACIDAVNTHTLGSVTFWRAEPEHTSAEVAVQAGGKLVKEVHPQHTWVVELQEPDTMLAAMKSKWRYNIRLAAKKGVTVRRSQSVKDMQAVHALLQATAKRQDIHIHPLSYYEQMVRMLGINKEGTSAQPELSVFVAEYEGEIIAGAIMMGYGDTYTYVHGGANHEHRAVMAPHAVQWAALEYAQQQGYSIYDFFGAAPPEHGKEHPWAGITRFKQGFGGHYVSRAGAVETPLHTMWYTMYKLGKQLRSG